MDFEWHSPKAKSNLQKHGVSFEEASTVFDDPLVDIQPDFAHSIKEARFTAVGRSAQGRFLVVVFTEKTDAMRIITAREPTVQERRHYESYDPFA
ncbi:MAG: BrnT family toxin [Blastocatellia bacterium]